jgi:hypothetical protein
MNESDCGKILVKFGTVYPNTGFTKEAIKVWHELFKSEDARIFHAAISAVSKEPGRRFFPTVGEVQAVVNRLKQGEQKTGEECFENLRELARRGKTPAYVERLIQKNQHAARALRGIGGFITVLNATDADMPFRKREFVRLYEMSQESREVVERLAIAGNVSGLVDDIAKKKAIA